MSVNLHPLSIHFTAAQKQQTSLGLLAFRCICKWPGNICINLHIALALSGSVERRKASIISKQKRSRQRELVTTNTALLVAAAALWVIAWRSCIAFCCCRWAQFAKINYLLWRRRRRHLHNTRVTHAHIIILYSRTPLLLVLASHIIQRDANTRDCRGAHVYI